MSIIAFSVSLVMAIKHNSVFVLSPLKQEQTTTSNFLLYENSTYGIKIQYPSGWDKIEDGIFQLIGIVLSKIWKLEQCKGIRYIP